MAGSLLLVLTVVVCTWDLLYGGGRCWTAASPTGVEEAISDDNVSTTVLPEGYVNAASEGIWQITETAGNDTAHEETDGLTNRAGWTSRVKEDNLETMEGWLNSGVISNDVYVPYRALGVWNRVGNSSEDWKRHLTKPSVLQRHHHDKISKVAFNERRRFPFQFHWQNNPKREFNYSRTT